MEHVRTTVSRLLHRFPRLASRRLEEVDLSKRALVFAPHPDDETLGCGGTIARLTERHTTVDIVFVTDGSASDTERLSKAELAALRREEAIEASRRLGVSPDHLHFLDLPDGALQNERARAQAAISDVIRRHLPEQPFAPYFREPPTDRRVTFELVRAAAQVCPRESRSTAFQYDSGVDGPSSHPIAA